MNNYDEFLNFVLGSKGGGEQSVTIVEPLSISENGVYTASEGYAFSPVTVDVTSGGGGEGITADDIAMRTISGAVSGSAREIIKYAFCLCYSITEASFPACTQIGEEAFYYCYSLTKANFPTCTFVGTSAFNSCNSLTEIYFPMCASIWTDAFAFCSSLTEVSFPACALIASSAFRKCLKLISFYLLGSSVATLSNSNAFSSTPIGGYSASAGQYGSIFVPSSLYNSYLTATNWSRFASRFVSV